MVYNSLHEYKFTVFYVGTYWFSVAHSTPIDQEEIIHLVQAIDHSIDRYFKVEQKNIVSSWIRTRAYLLTSRAHYRLHYLPKLLTKGRMPELKKHLSCTVA